MERENIYKTIIGTIILLLVLLFVPESALPEYNIIGYGAIAGLLLLMGGLQTNSSILGSSDPIMKIVKNMSIYLSILMPLGVLLYTNIKYKKKIQEKVEYVSNYQTLKLMTTIVISIQMYQLYNYIFSESITTNKILGIVLMSVLNSGLSVLLWSRVAFFITDGFRPLKN